jgi:hypothetical protein
MPNETRDIPFSETNEALFGAMDIVSYGFQDSPSSMDFSIVTDTA